MKKATFLATAMVLLMIVFVVPVMAEPTKEQKVDAFLYQKGVTYAKLNATCIAEGLGTNRYPIPVATEIKLSPGNPEMEHIRAASNYWNVTDLTIGAKHLKGYAQYIYTGLSARKVLGMAIHHFDATYYIGDLGDLNNGFEGWVQFKVYGWFAGTTVIDRATWHAELHGFGSFEGQTLSLSYEATNWAEFTGPGPWTGYCLKG